MPSRLPLVVRSLTLPGGTWLVMWTVRLDVQSKVFYRQKLQIAGCSELSVNRLKRSATGEKARKIKKPKMKWKECEMCD